MEMNLKLNKQKGREDDTDSILLSSEEKSLKQVWERCILKWSLLTDPQQTWVFMECVTVRCDEGGANEGGSTEMLRIRSISPPRPSSHVQTPALAEDHRFMLKRG